MLSCLLLGKMRMHTVFSEPFYKAQQFQILEKNRHQTLILAHGDARLWSVGRKMKPQTRGPGRSCAEVALASSEKPSSLPDRASSVVLFNLNTHDPNRRLPVRILVVSWECRLCTGYFLQHHWVNRSSPPRNAPHILKYLTPLKIHI